jgi:hypothetical protein
MNMQIHDPRFKVSSKEVDVLPNHRSTDKLQAVSFEDMKNSDPTLSQFRRESSKKQKIKTAKEK